MQSFGNPALVFRSVQFRDDACLRIEHGVALKALRYLFVAVDVEATIAPWTLDLHPHLLIPLRPRGDQVFGRDKERRTGRLIPKVSDAARYLYVTHSHRMCFNRPVGVVERFVLYAVFWHGSMFVDQGSDL